MAMKLYSQYTDPLNSTYEGKVQQARFTFALGPEQVDFINQFFANQYINDCKNAVRTESPTDDVLILRVYRDTAPTFQTDYILEITSTDRTGAALPWLSIIGLALIAIAIVYFVVRPALASVRDLVYGPEGNTGPTIASMIPWIAFGLLGYMVFSSGTLGTIAKQTKKK